NKPIARASARGGSSTMTASLPDASASGWRRAPPGVSRSTNAASRRVSARAVAPRAIAIAATSEATHLLAFRPGRILDRWHEMLFRGSRLALVGVPREAGRDLVAQPFGRHDRVDGELGGELLHVDVGSVLVAQTLDVRLALCSFGDFLDLVVIDGVD